MILKIINKSSNPLPKYESAQAAGMDIRCNIAEAITLQPMERKLIPTGLFIELPAGFEAQIRPRSGLALKRGLTVLNTPGTIDADYRGEVGVILINRQTRDTGGSGSRRTKRHRTRCRRIRAFRSKINRYNVITCLRHYDIYF